MPRQPQKAQHKSLFVPPEIGALVHGFSRHLRELRKKETKEATIRQNYIDPFWKALGWDVGDQQQLGPSECEVIIEKNVETAESGGLRNRRPDYLFRLGGFPRFIVEAKRPIVDIDADKDAIFQAKQYAWNSTIPFAILTDFEQFRLYDTTLKPIFEEPRRGLVSEYALNYESYEAQWDVLTSIFGHDAVAGGSLERLLANIKKIRPGKRLRTVDRMLIDLKGGEPVDQEFLAYLDTHRRHFAAAIYRDNKPAFPEADTLHGAAKLTEAVQRIMDRLVFMRVIEDRGIATWGSLREMLERIGGEGGEFYEALCAKFREYDSKYNGYLYKPHFSEELRVDGAVIADFTRSLYPPDGPWDFAAIGDDILGIVYERFLGNTIEIRKGRVEVQLKPEYKKAAKKTRHKTGVFYTPRFVVASIIRRVIGPKVEGKTPADVLDVKILDPACGSGSFLVAALQYLFDYCLAAVNKDSAVARAVVPALSESTGGRGRKKKAEIAFQDKDGRWYLAPDFRASLLTHCIHGVDIDQQAVEVTVMSLYLKMLESKLPENWATLWVERQLLPSLDNNIQCGNSLIDDDSYFRFREKLNKNQPTLYDTEDADTSFRINRFDWASHTRGFGRLLAPLPTTANPKPKPHAFDCIIGNPPYIRVQELNKWASEECEFYKWKYGAAVRGNYDIYVVFAERALSLLAPKGLLGFIMPNKWWHAQYGEGLRKIVADARHLRSLVDFTDQQVFTGATTYTAIHIFQEQKGEDEIDVAAVTELKDGQAQCAAIDQQETVQIPGVVRFVASAPRGTDPWSFHSTDDEAWCQRVSGNHPRLVDVAPDIFVGLQTSADTVFVFEEFEERKSLTRATSLELGHRVDLEADVLRPVIRSGEIGRHWANSTARVLFPYRVADSRATIISPERMKADYPLAWKYLKANEKMLRGRESGKFDHDEWYGLMRKNLERWESPKVMVPYMITDLGAWFDEGGDHYFVNVTTGGFGIRTSRVDMRYLAALLSSSLLDRWFKSQAGRFHSGYFGANKQYLENIPIIVPQNADDRKLTERIVASVRVIMDAKAALRAPVLSDRERDQLTSAVETHESRINKTVFELYDVDGLPE